MKRSYIVAAAIAVGIVLWMLSGQFESPRAKSADETAAAQPASQKQDFAVRARTFQSQPHNSELQIRGRTEALRIVEVRAETSGRVIALPVVEGTSVGQGDLLCALDVRDREARVREAEAAVRQRSMEFKAAEELSGQGFRSETQKAASEAALDAAQAALTAAKIDLDNTQIAAPFDGVLDELGVEIGELVQMGEVCAVIVDQDPFLVVAQVAEREVGMLRVGMESTARLVTGETVTGRIRFIATRAEASTRTFRVEIEVPNEDGYLRDGVTAEITIPLESVEAHKITPAYLTLNAAGTIGVRIIENGDTVRFRPVTVIEDTGDGVWVAGLTPSVTIITVGQDFVVDGQRVTVQMEQGSATPGQTVTPSGAAVTGSNGRG